MKRRKFCLSLAASGTAGVASAQRGESPPPTAAGRLPLADSTAEKRILAVIEEARSSGDVYLEVPVIDGRMLRVLTETANAKQVVEFGTSTGYSGLWFSLALRATGGKLTTFELDAQRAAHARKHFEQAGVSNLIRVIEGDAHKNVNQIKGPVDVVFIDAEKEGYVDYLKAVLPLVRPGGLLLAHNIPMVQDYVNAVTSDPKLDTVFYMHGGGLGITLKKI
jgi:caffeoyl-CoA O-methyltransferase